MSGQAVERRGAAFARAWSLEATRPGTAELAALQGVLEPGAPIYLSAVPSRPHAELAATAVAVRAAGFEPVPHLAARGFAAPDAVADFLARFHNEADGRRVLLIGGDVDRAGAFAGALALIESGLLARGGIEEIGIAGYPDGHPRIGEAALAQALHGKIAAARRAGLRVHIVTQFCFASEPIIVWLRRLRQSGVAVPVQVGLVGPTSLPTLLRFAQRCGVRASARGLMRTGFARALGADASPDALIEALLRSEAEIGDIAPHFFSFGGVVRTARYGRDAAAKQFASTGEGHGATRTAGSRP